MFRSIHSLFAITVTFAALVITPADAAFQAGVSTVSITPTEAGLPTQLGGYGERLGKPAVGVHDTITAKTLLLQQGDEMAAVVTLDVCSLPGAVLTASVEKAAIEGLTVDRVLMAASHTHGGLEGFSLDPRNIANNPRIGIFDQAVFDFVVDRIAGGLKEAHAALQPATAAAGATELTGMTRNRRKDEFVDDQATVFRVDRADGTPLAVLVNFTAHGTIMTEKEMLVSGGWPGVMQRTVEAIIGDDVTCLYVNGAEGDISPTGAQGGSRWEMAEDYGRRVGIGAAAVAADLETKPVEAFDLSYSLVDLPTRVAAPQFLQIAGVEYGVSEEELESLIQALWPEAAPMFGLRVNDFAMVSYPGEAICQFGLQIKQALREQGIAYPCISGLTSEHIGYVLTKEEYHEGGYEATVSFYGDGLGQQLLDEALDLGAAIAK